MNNGHWCSNNRCAIAIVQAVVRWTVTGRRAGVDVEGSSTWLHQDGMSPVHIVVNHTCS